MERIEKKKKKKKKSEDAQAVGGVDAKSGDGAGRFAVHPRADADEIGGETGRPPVGAGLGSQRVRLFFARREFQTLGARRRRPAAERRRRVDESVVDAGVEQQRHVQHARLVVGVGASELRAMETTRTARETKKSDSIAKRMPRPEPFHTRPFNE